MSRITDNLVWVVPLAISILAAYGVVSNELIKDGEKRISLLEYKVEIMEKQLENCKCR